MVRERGMSQVVSVIIIVFLTLMLLGLISIVIFNLIEKKADDASSSVEGILENAKCSGGSCEEDGEEDIENECTPSYKEENIALNRDATQSLEYSGCGAELDLNSCPAYLAFDGNLNTIQHTQNYANQWLKVDLGQVYNIGKFELVKRADCCQNRPDVYKIQVSNESIFTGEEIDVVIQSDSSCSEPSCVMEHSIINTPVSGRYVRVLNTFSGSGDKNFLNIAEFRVFEYVCN